MDLARLRRDHPWPAARPDLPPLDHGWFQHGSRRLLAARFTPATRLVVELGSWVGQSTGWILDNTPPAASVVAIDHWKGGPDHLISRDPEVVRLLPVLFDQFCANLWPHRDRLVPVRLGTLEGMRAVAACGLAPDVVFIDADHTTAAVVADIVEARTLFPAARIVGDDWKWASVCTAVRQAAANYEMSIIIDENAWALEPQ